MDAIDHVSHPYSVLAKLDENGVWHTANHSQSSAHSTPIFSSENRHQDISGSYPSPVSSIESPHFIHNPLTDQFPVHQHSPTSNTLNIASQFTQIESSIGPSRLTRRPRPGYELERRSSLPSTFSRTEHDHVPRHHPVMYLSSPAIESRPQTPSCNQNISHRDRLSLSMETVAPLPIQPSPYHPPTPSSSASSFSPYHLYPTHSRSSSSSTSMGPRATSPALSNTSALTSISSGSGSHPQTYSPYPRIAHDHASSSQGTRPKQRKQRLVNAQRKQICLDHLSNDKLRQEDIAAKYGVERSTLINLRTPSRPSKFPDIEENLVLWLQDCKAKNMSGHLSDASIRMKAKEVARALAVTEEKFKASSGWVENFKQRHGIRGGNWHGDGRITHMGALASSVHDPAPTLSLDLRSESFDVVPSSGHPLMESSQSDDRMHDETSMSLQPAWPEHHTDSSQHNPPQHMQDGMSQSGIMHTPSTPILAASQQHISDVDRQTNLAYPSTYDSLETIYQPVPRIPDNSPPTLADAEEAINRVIAFLDSTGQGIIQHQQREVLGDIKIALFHAGSGVPFNRSQS
ncbi:hypothetical protein BDN72DRAFT_854606 [Pluteus cervinus]|uniref:Uncharacterized protein n=1 Tax=Pluteus cervinus TaxID=181527 RepID=A0ACD3B7E9_9AGAR|nr:hypothetical protein BDN72DRAFT_854606 [Pluteus cervinus]